MKDGKSEIKFDEYIKQITEIVNLVNSLSPKRLEIKYPAKNRRQDCEP